MNGILSSCRLAALAVFTALLVVVAPAIGSDDLAQRVTWLPPTAEVVKAQLDAWLAALPELDEAEKLKFEAMWPAEAEPVRSDAMLDQVCSTFAIVDERARDVVLFCREGRKRVELPKFEILSDQATSPFVRANLKLLYGRWLAQQQLYDEAIATLEGLNVEEVVDPAALLFYQSVAYHRVLNKDKCLPTLERLLENEAIIPRRFGTVAKLMEADLKPLKADSLDEIARLMDSIRIELDHARAGKRVRDRQDEVIAKLDKMIDDLEKKRQQQQQASSSQSAPSSPMQDSQAAGGTGPGNVDPKKLGSKAGWGNLPPKERQEAMQQISKEFPSHFREVIEEYFRKLARDNEE